MTLDVPTGVAIAIGGIPILLIGTGRLRAIKTEEAQHKFLQGRAKYFRIFGTVQMVCGAVVCAVSIYLATANP